MAEKNQTPAQAGLHEVENVKDVGKKIAVDTSSGSRVYNRFDMQISQTLHMAIELYDSLDYVVEDKR